MRLLRVWMPVLLLMALGLAFIDIHFRADVFSLLPAHAPTVKGLKRYQREFGSSHAVIIAVTGMDRESTHADVEQLAQLLKQNQLTNHVVWQSPFREDTTALGELLAYLWINQSPTDFDKMRQGMEAITLPDSLAEVLERIATSFNAEEVGRLACDPLGLLTVAEKIADQAGGDPFVSRDGRFRILHALYPGESPGYWQYRDWLADIRGLVSQAQQQGILSSACTVRYTGNPVFVVEFGWRMLRDLTLAAVSTGVLVMLLFWWAYRRWRPMFWLGALLASVLILTVLGGTWYFGSLNAISLGFAAILMGLAADYGLIVYQEYRTHPHYSPWELTRVLAPSILWAAATTAGAFLMVARSSLPGLNQLGTLVAIGILTAALLVLTTFVASIKHSIGSVAVSKPDSEARGFQVLAPQALPVWPLTVGLILVSLLILLFNRPSIDTDAKSLQFQNIVAQEVHDDIQAHIEAKVQGSENDLWLIVSGANEQQVKERLAEAQVTITAAQTRGVSLQVHLPSALWPDAEAQQRNRPLLKELTAERERICTQILASGFDTDSLTLTQAAFNAWQTFGVPPVTAGDLSASVWPQSEGGRWIFDQFSSRGSDSVLALGLLSMDPSVSKSDQSGLVAEINGIEGVQLTGWSLLADSLSDTMIGDTLNVLLPMMVVLLVCLGLAFRDWRDMMLSFVTLLFMLVCLGAAMALLGWSWNLMNMAAIPLLLGAGVDYSIHIQLALKRYHGDSAQAHRSVGSAILLCGASTVAAFASLGLASNPGMASLGRVAALGITIASGTAVFLLPGWWCSLRRVSGRAK